MPPTDTLPRVGATMPSTSFVSVVLPAPLRPVMAIFCPKGMASVMSLTISVPPG